MIRRNTKERRTNVTIITFTITCNPKKRKAKEKVMFVCQKFDVQTTYELVTLKQRHLAAFARTKKRMLSQEHYAPGVCKKDPQKTKQKIESINSALMNK